MKTVQFFSDDYLRQCKKMKPAQILRFLEDFRLLQEGVSKSERQLISIRIPKNILSSFKEKSELNGIAYQTQIQRLMLEWVKK